MILYVAIMVEAAKAGTADAAVVQKSLKFQFVFAKPVQLAKFHCSGRLLWRDDTIKTPFGMGAGASLRNKLEKGPSAVNSSPTLQKWLKLSKPDIHICFVGVKGFYWYCIADSFGWENMSRKAAPKPEELIQKLEEKFDGFKVRQVISSK